MKKGKRLLSGPKRLSARIAFPNDESVHPWLTPLLDAYAILDTGVSIAVREAGKKKNISLACTKGCDACCSQKDIPLYPHEVIGIYWYAAEKITGADRAGLKSALSGSGPDAPCPFLIEHACIIHPVRPFSCRQFNVFRRQCTHGEDPYFSRRSDVLVPRADYTDRAFEAVIPLYNIDRGMDRAEAVRLIRSQIMNLRAFEWKGLLAVMEKAEGRLR